MYTVYKICPKRRKSDKETAFCAAKVTEERPSRLYDRLITI